MIAMRQLRRLSRNERGATIVELAFVIPLLLLLFFILIDFGRLAHHWVAAEKAVQMAARMAAVRPPVCALPQVNEPGAGNAAKFGASCNSAGAICEGEVTAVAPCSGSAANATANHIFTSIAPLLPPDATAANLRFRYSYDADMNFLGGPYVPVVTVELQNLQFGFASPLLGLARLAGASNVAAGQTYAPIPFPSMSVSLPGEDLALGMDG